MLRAEDLARTQRYKKPYTSVIPFLKAEAEKNNPNMGNREKTTKPQSDTIPPKSIIITPEERLKDDPEALKHLSPASCDEERIRYLLEGDK